MVKVEIEELDPNIDPDSNLSCCYMCTYKTVDTITFKEFKDYLNSLPEDLDHLPLIWENTECGSSGGYEKPQDIIQIFKDRIFI